MSHHIVRPTALAVFLALTVAACAAAPPAPPTSTVRPLVVVVSAEGQTAARDRRCQSDCGPEPTATADRFFADAATRVARMDGTTGAPASQSLRAVGASAAENVVTPTMPAGTPPAAIASRAATPAPPLTSPPAPRTGANPLGPLAGLLDAPRVRTATGVPARQDRPAPPGASPTSTQPAVTATPTTAAPVAPARPQPPRR